MIERRRRFFNGDSLLDMPIPRGSCNSFQFACVFQSATGIIVFSQLVIATPLDAEKLMHYVEGLSVSASQTQIQFHLSIFAASSGLHAGRGILSADAR
jgi:hypothetical protein